MRESKMKDEAVSSGTMDPSARARFSPPQTPAASSVGLSTPAILTNMCSTDWVGNAYDCKEGSLSCVGPRGPHVSLSPNADGSVPESPLCRPWERVDLLRRLATFMPSNWLGKPQGASSLACARRGWVNTDIDKIDCEICGASVNFFGPASSEVDASVEAFTEQLDAAHKVTCPWRGNICADGLIQFPPTPPSALIEGFKDRFDGLLQFPSLPLIPHLVIEKMRLSRSTQIDHFLSQLNPLSDGESSFKLADIFVTESAQSDTLYGYCRAQKLISLCGWEPRWLPNMQDCEENSTQSARNACSFCPTQEDLHHCQYTQGSKNFSSTSRLERANKSIEDFRLTLRSPLLDCCLCGATVKLRDFVSVNRPPCFGPNDEITDQCKKVLTCGVSAASGINGWVDKDGVKIDQMDDLDDAATDNEEKSPPNTDADLNLAVTEGLPHGQLSMPLETEQFDAEGMCAHQMTVQPSESVVGDRAASYESRGPSSRKRNLEGGGSTVDRPQDIFQQADSVEGIVVDHAGDEIYCGMQDIEGPSKRARGLGAYDSNNSFHGFTSAATPIHAMSRDANIDVTRVYSSKGGSDQAAVLPSVGDSVRASSVIAMNTIGRSVEDDSMDSVENHPGDAEEVRLPSPSVSKNSNLNEELENYGIQAQQSTCQEPADHVTPGEMGVSSTNDGEEILNIEVVSHARDGPSFGISGGSVGMGASHEAEIHGADVTMHGTESNIADAEAIAEVTENVGQTGDSLPSPGLMGEFVPEEIDKEDAHGDNQEMMSRLGGKEDNDSKVCVSNKAESVESGGKDSHKLISDGNAHPSLSCNAVICSAYEAPKEEVTQVGKTADEYTLLESDYVSIRQKGQGDTENMQELQVPEFDPIRYHNIYCPWVNGNVAAAGCSTSSSSSSVAPCGWELTLDALDTFQRLGHIPNQAIQSESAASLYKDDHLSPSRELKRCHSVSESHGKI